MIEWSGCHFLKVFKRYQSYSPCDMLQSIKKGVKGDLENVFLNLVQCIQNKPLYFADRRAFLRTMHTCDGGVAKPAKACPHFPCTHIPS
ncbi:hypothetical protein R6Z07F_015997 [Ovis aries]